MDQKQKQQQELVRSPGGRLHISTDCLLRPNGQPVAPTKGCAEPVYINVYDLHWINRMAKRLRLAAYHTGLELHGVEIAYGDCGVFTMKNPRDASLMEAQMVYKKSVHLGETCYSREDALLISRRLGRIAFTGPTYDLLRRNCNHFSAAFGRLLCPDAEFPAWINSLAAAGLRVPFVERGIRRYMEADDTEEENDENAKNKKPTVGGKKCDSESADAGNSSSATIGDATILKEKRRRGLREICANLSRVSAGKPDGKLAY